MKQIQVLVAFASLLFASCSGGGGGGGASGNGETLTRSTGTGLRVIHAGLDATPVSLVIGSGEERNIVQTARFAETKFYQGISAGPVALSIERAETPGATVASFPTTLDAGVEYTAIVYGEASSVGLRTAFVEDVVSRPESGRALVNVFNAYVRDGLNVTIGESVYDELAYGAFGGFTEITSGDVLVSVTTDGGQPLGSFTVSVPDRGEATLVVMGSAGLGVVFFPVYLDLD